jgi:hypothetical protein
MPSLFKYDMFGHVCHLDFLFTVRRNVNLRVRASLSTSVLYSVYSFINQWLYSPLLGSGLSFSFVIFFTQTAELEREISPPQGRYLHTGQHKQGISGHTDIYALSGIQIHDPSVRASFRPHKQYDFHTLYLFIYIYYICTLYYYTTISRTLKLVNVCSFIWNVPCKCH